MNTQLDDMVRRAVSDLLDLAPDAPPRPLDTTLVGDTLRPHGRVALAAASLVVVAGTAGLLAVQARPEPAPAEQPPTTTETNVPAVVAMPQAPEVFPAFPLGDARNVGAEGSYTQIAPDNPARTTAAVARRDGDRLVDGITITGYAELDDDTFLGAETTRVVVNGVELSMFVEPGTPVLSTVVLPGPLPVAVSGVDPVAFLTAAGNPVAHAKVGTGAGGGQVTLTLLALPPGYELITAPTPLPLGAREANLSLDAAVAGNEDGAVIGVAVVPLTTEVAGGPLRSVDINGTAGWATDGPGHAVTWPVGDDTWATVAGVESTDEALTLAGNLQFVDEATWRATYDVAAPNFPTTD